MIWTVGTGADDHDYQSQRSGHFVEKLRILFLKVYLFGSLLSALDWFVK